MGIGSQVKLFGDELRAVVHLHPLRHPILGHRQVGGRNKIIALVAESHPDKGTNRSNVIYGR